MVYDEYDTLPNCQIFGVYIDDNLVTTLRMHHVTEEMPHSPVMSVYGDSSATASRCR